MKDWRTAPYWEIIKQSWQIILKNRYLWWLGFLIALPGVFNYNYSFRPDSSTDWTGLISRGNMDVQNFIANQGGGFWVALVVISFFVLMFFVVLSFIGRGGLIESVFDIRKGKPGSFKDGLRKGWRHLIRLLIIGFTITFLAILVIALIAIPIFILFLKGSYSFGIIFSLCALAILIPSLFIAFFLKTYGYIYAVSSKLTFSSSLENAYNLLLINWKSSLIMLILFLPMNFFLFLTFMSFAAILALIFLIIGVGVWFLAGKAGIIIVAVIGLLMILIVLAVLKSAFEAFSQTIWVLFFSWIASPEENETVPVAAETEKKKIGTAPAPTPTMTKVDK